MHPDLAVPLADLREVTARARRAFGGAGAAQLAWRPAPAEWSVAQCFEHVMLINAAYFPLLARIARGDWSPGWKERVPLWPRLAGRLVLNLTQPDSRRKVNALPRFQPSPGEVEAALVDRFVAHQETLARHMEATAGRDLRATIIVSPVAGFLTYSLLDAYRIIAAHERQHLAQAERVLAAPGFPRA